MTMCRKSELSLREVIGQGYNKFWHSRARYRVVMGSRGSKKSVTSAINHIVRMMEFPLANLLVIRQVEKDLRQSCYAQLKWAINRLGVESRWKCTTSPLQMTYIPTGQKIIFRGLDKWTSITSMTVEKGFLCWCWLEEAFEVDETSFQAIDESFRGILPEGYFLQFTLTFNPWDSGSWLKRRFFDVEDDPDIFTLRTTYQCNEWLSDADRAMFDRMKRTDPERYKVAGLGEWGVAAGQYFRQWRTDLHVVEPFKIPDGWTRFRSMDWGSARPYAVHWWAIDYDGNLWCYRELYGYGGKPNVGTGETAKQVGERIAELERPEERVHYGVLDNACWAATGVTGPTIAEEINNVLYEHKLVTFSPSSKGRDEGANALKQRLIGNEEEDGSFTPAIRFFATCIHTIRTLPMLAHDKHKPETYDTAGEDHAVDSVVYACLSRPWAPVKQQPARPHDRWRRESTRSGWTY